MSWFFGIICRDKVEEFNFNGILIQSALPLNKRVLSFAAGGNRTTLFSSSSAESFNWAISGVGIQEKGDTFKIINSNDWDFTVKENFQPECLNGHFAAVIKNLDELLLTTDIMGLRDIYLFQDKEKIVFTTRIDLLSRYTALEIDFNQFGGKWILINQLSTKCIFKNILRITAGTRAVINLNSFEIKTTNDNWLPDFSKKSSAKTEICQILKSLITFPNENDFKISLSLSGGFDSRLILAHLLQTGRTGWNTHTFGDPRHPDSIIAKSIAEYFKFENETVLTPGIGNDTLIALNRYAASMNLNTPASAFLQLDNYLNIKNKNDLIIDGGFGEILRREFLNKLLWKCKNNLIHGRIKDILPFLRLFKADFFNDDITKQMETGALEQLSELISSLPSLQHIEIEDWLDLFSIKTRLPNYYGPDQARLDGIQIDFMPFTQPVFLSKLFSLPVKYRRNGMFSREIIRNLEPGLTGFQLAKGNTIIPFFMNSFQSRAWSFIQRKLKNNIYHDHRTIEMLISLKEYILDSVNSKEVEINPVYDYQKVKNTADGFYSGNLKYSGQLDWWLAFHLFYKSNNISG